MNGVFELKSQMWIRQVKGCRWAFWSSISVVGVRSELKLMLKIENHVSRGAFPSFDLPPFICGICVSSAF